MNGKTVITIGRMCGSGGHLIGEKIAKRLGIRCYDKELLTIAAKQSGMNPEIFETHDEKPTNSFLYSLVMDSYAMGYTTSSFVDLPLNHKIFLAQFETIKKIASEESCVIIGRCADYALEDDPDVTRVFITADDRDRINYLMRIYPNLKTEKEARDYMEKTDKKRTSYYNYYSNKTWGEAKGYDLCLNVSRLTAQGCVDLILDYVTIKSRYAGKPFDNEHPDERSGKN